MVFLYFELTCSQQMCDFFQTSKAMLGEPGGGWPGVWWHQIGGSQIPVRPMEKPCSKGGIELVVLGAVVAGSPWNVIHQPWTSLS